MRGNGVKPLAETTVAQHHSMIKAAYNWATDEELIAVNAAQVEEHSGSAAQGAAGPFGMHLTGFRPELGSWYRHR